VSIPAAHELKRMFVERSDEPRQRMKQNKQVHVIASGLKALNTWLMSAALQACREACGGQGFKADNRIGIIKSETDVWLTFEGDNYVLMAQVAQELLKEFKKGMQTGKFQGRLQYMPAINSAQNPLDFDVPVDWDKTSQSFQPVQANASDKLVLHPLWQLWAFRMREGRLIQHFVNKFMSLKGKGASSYDAANLCCK
jgi:acyl-CoA oxidase